jgi:hypothetical protein
MQFYAAVLGISSLVSFVGAFATGVSLGGATGYRKGERRRLLVMLIALCFAFILSGAAAIAIGSEL